MTEQTKQQIIKQIRGRKAGELLYLQGANLDGCTMNWNSNELISWRLYNLAETTKQMELSALVIIGRKGIGDENAWCWPEWMAYEHPAKQWAIAAMRMWGKEGDNMPDCLRGKKETK